MKKYFLLIALAFITFKNSNAQEYHHGIGIQYNYAIFRTAYTNPYVNYSGISGASVPGIVYKATLGFEISSSMNFAVSSYPFLGFSYNSSYGGYFGVELPIVAELYLGDIDEGCFFLGAGGSMGFFGSSGYGAGPVIGPQGLLGGQFNFRGRVIGLKLAYTYGLNKTKNDDPETVYSIDKRFMFSLGGYMKFG